MMFSGGLLDCDETHAQLVGPLGDVPQDAFAIALFDVVLPLVGEFLASKGKLHRRRQSCILPSSSETQRS